MPLRNVVPPRLPLETKTTGNTSPRRAPLSARPGLLTARSDKKDASGVRSARRAPRSARTVATPRVTGLAAGGNTIVSSACGSNVDYAKWRAENEPEVTVWEPTFSTTQVNVNLGLTGMFSKTGGMKCDNAVLKSLHPLHVTL